MPLLVPAGVVGGTNGTGFSTGIGAVPAGVEGQALVAFLATRNSTSSGFAYRPSGTAGSNTPMTLVATIEDANSDELKMFALLNPVPSAGGSNLHCSRGPSGGMVGVCWRVTGADVRSLSHLVRALAPAAGVSSMPSVNLLAARPGDHLIDVTAQRVEANGVLTGAARPPDGYHTDGGTQKVSINWAHLPVTGAGPHVLGWQLPVSTPWRMLGVAIAAPPSPIESSRAVHRFRRIGYRSTVRYRRLRS